MIRNGLQYLILAALACVQGVVLPAHVALDHGTAIHEAVDHHVQFHHDAALSVPHSHPVEHDHSHGSHSNDRDDEHGHVHHGVSDHLLALNRLDGPMPFAHAVVPVPVDVESGPVAGFEPAELFLPAVTRAYPARSLRGPPVS